MPPRTNSGATPAKELFGAVTKPAPLASRASGFGAGSQFTWEAIGTYNWLLCVTNGIPVDGYVGFRALSADHSQGSGTSKFGFDNVIYGPVIGATIRF